MRLTPLPAFSAQRHVFTLHPETFFPGAGFFIVILPPFRVYNDVNSFYFILLFVKSAKIPASFS